MSYEDYQFEGDFGDDEDLSDTFGIPIDMDPSDENLEGDDGRWEGMIPEDDYE